MTTRHFPIRRPLATAALLALASASAPAATFSWITGDHIAGLTFPEPLSAADELQISGAGTKRFVGTTMTNNGLVRWLGGSTVQGGNSAAIANAGTWQFEADGTALSWNFGGRPTFTNTGTVAKTAGALTTLGDWAFVNNGGLISSSAGDLRFTGNDTRLNSGTRVSGAGTVSLATLATISGDLFSDNLVLASGTTTGNGAVLQGGVAAGAGLLSWTGGDIAGSFTVAAGSTWASSGAAAKRQIGSSIVNNGTWRWDTTSTLQGGNSSSITNNGLLEATQSAAFTWNFGGRHALVNSASGTVRAADGVTLTLGDIAVTSNGGTFATGTGGVIVYSGSANQFNDGTRFDGDHRVSGTGNYAGNIVSSNGSLRWLGTQNGADATLSGLVLWQGGDVAGSFTLAAGQTLRAETGLSKRFIGTQFNNLGTFVWDTTTGWQTGNSSSFVNRGLLEATQSATLSWNYGGRHALINEAGAVVRASNGATLTIGDVALTSNGGTFETAAGSTIVYSGSANRFNAGTQFVGEHRVTGAAVYVGSIVSSNGSLQWAGGSHTGGDGSPGSRGTLTGLTRWQAGDTFGSFTIASGQTLQGEGSGSKRQLGSSIINNGTLRWATATQLQGGNSSSIVNNGLLEATESAVFGWNFGGRALMENTATGTVRATHNATLTFGDVGLTSNGGLFEATAGSAIAYTGNATRFNDGTRFVGDNRVGGTSVWVGGITGDAGLRLVGGSHTGGDGSAGSAGRILSNLNWGQGDLFGRFEIAAGATLLADQPGSRRMIGGRLVNDGTVLWSDSNGLQAGNSAVLENNGRFEMAGNGGVVWAFGGQAQLVNNGLFIKSAGSGATSLSSLAVTNNGTIDVASGSISLPTSFANAGLLKGSGTFNVASGLVNNGHVAPGNSPGTLSIVGGFNNTALGTLDIELASAASHDLLLVSGNVQLAGTLALHCFALCGLAVGDELVVLDGTGSLTGTFAGLTLTGFASGAFDTIYDRAGARVLLRVTQATAPIPEPGTWALMALGLVGVGAVARRRARG